MKLKQFVCLLALSLLVPLYGQQEVEDNAPKVRERESKKMLENSDIFIGMPDFNPRLTANLVEKILATDSTKLSGMLKSKKVVLSLNVWKLSSLCDRQTFINIAKTPEGLTFLSTFLRDGEWLENFLNSGPLQNPDMTVNYLAEIFKKDPSFPAKPVLKKLATATALEYGRNGWPQNDCLERYAFYKNSYEYNQLNPVFGTLDYWDMRIVAGCKNETWGTVKNLTWMRDNIRLPISGYCGAAYQVPYRLENYFGDSIHGSDYYRCFNQIYECQAEMSREVGAVCGGLSHYGAFAALSNGVPALTMGEPGHCAYTVRVDGKWLPCNSVFGYRRGAHWNMYGPEWAMLFLTQEFMSDNEKLVKSGRYERVGDLLSIAGDVGAARDFYIRGLKEQPRNIARWRDYIDWETKQGSLDVKSWQSINDSVCKYFGEDYAELCIQLLNSKVYPQLLPKLTEFNRQLDEVAKFHKVARKQGPLAWDMGKALTTQFKSMTFQDKKALEAMMKLLIQNHAKDSEFAGLALSWCMQQTDAHEDLKKSFLDDIGKLLARPGSVQTDALVNLADSMIQQAQKNDDITAFQAVGLMMKKSFKEMSLPKYKTPPGELLSKGGLVKFSCYQEDPTDLWKQWGILEKCGGAYISDKDKTGPYGTVLLSSMGLIQGVVVITEKAPKDATKDIRDRTLLIEASEDGTNWVKLDEVRNIEDINIINTMKSPVRAKQIKITRTGGGKGNWTVKAIHVYGRRVS